MSRGQTAPAEAVQPVARPFLTLTHRMSPNVVQRLQTASATRKPKRIFPWTQQDIIEAAIRDWLVKEGFPVE